jgi:hypothetical protein
LQQLVTKAEAGIRACSRWRCRYHTGGHEIITCTVLCRLSFTALTHDADDEPLTPADNNEAACYKGCGTLVRFRSVTSIILLGKVSQRMVSLPDCVLHSYAMSHSALMVGVHPRQRPSHRFRFRFRYGMFYIRGRPSAAIGTTVVLALTDHHLVITHQNRTVSAAAGRPAAATLAPALCDRCMSCECDAVSSCCFKRSERWSCHTGLNTPSIARSPYPPTFRDYSKVNSLAEFALHALLTSRN